MVRVAHRLQHVRRLERARGAGRARRHRDAFQVECDEQRFRLHPIERDVGGVGHPRRPLAVDAAPGTRSRMPCSSRSRSAAMRGAASAACCRAYSAAAPIPASAGTFSVPERRLRSWRPPVTNGCSRTPRRIHSAPAPLGPPNLWAEIDSRSTPSARDAHRQLARRLHGVGVEQRAVAAGDGGQVGHRLDRAYLVIGVHDRYEGRAIGHQPTQGVGIGDAAAAHRQEAHLETPPGQRLGGLQHGFVLDRGDNQVPPARRLEGLGGTAQGGVVAFRATRGEDDFGRLGAQQPGHRGARLVDRGLRLLAEMVDARRVAPGVARPRR